MKYKLFLGFLMFFWVVGMFLGCAGYSPGNIPYPEKYIVPKDESNESSEKTTNKNETDVRLESVADNIETEETKDAIAVSSTVNTFFDTSGSMKRSPEVVRVHSAASKAGAGYNKHYYTLNRNQDIIETDEKLSLSGQYGVGAIIDLIGKTEIPVDSSGINILTTDLQSPTSCTDIGKWLVSTESTGYSFYVFNMAYEGSLEFRTYTSSSIQEKVSISNCCFSDKEFLMIVFGENGMVEGFDKRFQSKLSDSINYDMIHIVMNNERKQKESFIKFDTSKCFTDNIANIMYDNTNYCYGVSKYDEKDEKFTVDNTFVYTKNNKSANDDIDAVKVILYNTSDKEVPSIVGDDTKVKVLEYDSSENTYQESSVAFTVDVETSSDGLRAAEDDESLNDKLGGNLVLDGSVLTVVIENKDLPKGLYAVEVQLKYETAGMINDFQKFVTSHNAGLEEYTAALKNECEPQISDGKINTSRYIYSGSIADSVFTKLLEFERLTDELVASKAVADNNIDIATLRVIIDNR